jgi:hypothetical protein
MADEVTQAQGEPARDRSVNVWMLVAIIAIALALIAGYLAYSYKRQVDDWEAAAEQTVETLQAAGAIIFQEGSVWRVAEVSTEAEIMVEGQSVTLDEFAALLESPDPEDAALANADDQVEVSGGLVKSIQTAPA